MSGEKTSLLHGTLELLILRLVQDDAMNGYAMGRRLAEITGDALKVDEGSLYPALYRMERRGWLGSSWGKTENNRRAKFYRITPAGRKRLERERAGWASFSEAVDRVLEST